MMKSSLRQKSCVVRNANAISFRHSFMQYELSAAGLSLFTIHDQNACYLQQSCYYIFSLGDVSCSVSFPFPSPIYWHIFTYTSIPTKENALSSILLFTLLPYFHLMVLPFPSSIHFPSVILCHLIFSQPSYLQNQNLAFTISKSNIHRILGFMQRQSNIHSAAGPFSCFDQKQ